MLKKCPQYAFKDRQQIQVFYDGLCHATRSMVVALACGSINLKTYDEAFQLIEMMASNDYRLSQREYFQSKK